MSIGLTESMRRAHATAVCYLARHGAMPSIQGLADELGCSKNNARRAVLSLIERGVLHRRDDKSLALGSGGVGVTLPPHVAAALASYCLKQCEDISAVLADAVMLHLDQIESSGRVD